MENVHKYHLDSGDNYRIIIRLWVTNLSRRGGDGLEGVGRAFLMGRNGKGLWRSILLAHMHEVSECLSLSFPP